MPEIFDYIVVGGGTAGCILAARLSANPEHSVLLIEAGKDYGPGGMPGEVLDARYVPMRGHAPTFDPSHDWGLSVKSGGSTAISVPQAKLVGGGSAINGSIALRGATADYREWEAAGNPEWTWDKVLPTFIALENDDAPGDFHGHSGPVPLTRATADELANIQGAFVQSALAAGAQSTEDLNAPDAQGVGSAPQMRVGGRRISTAETHLDPVRGRTNLTIRDQTLVAKVSFDGTHAIGVELVDGTSLAATREVVLTAGAILTPAILQRSGVGPPDLLTSLGISIVRDLPVGENLADHFSVPLMAVPKPGAWKPNDFSLQTVWRTSTSVQPGSLDAQFTTFSYLNARTTGEGTRGLAGGGAADIENVAGIGCNLNKPRSVGTVRISAIGAATLPQVDPNYLHQKVDRDAIREIVRLGWRIITSTPLVDLLEAPLEVDPRVFDNDQALDRFISVRTASGYHFSGTCKMGAQDRSGVVDQLGRLHGLSGIRIADASVIPTSPAANTVLTTIMVAERISAMITGELVV